MHHDDHKSLLQSIVRPRKRMYDSTKEERSSYGPSVPMSETQTLLVSEVPRPGSMCSRTIKVSIALSVLCAVTAGERVSFKILVDRIIPFRYLLVPMLVLFESCALCIVLQSKKTWAPSLTHQPFPRRKPLLIMACLDLCKDFMMVMSGCFVSPTLTVLLLQGNVPIAMAMTYCYSAIRRRRVNRPSLDFRANHFLGAAIIALSVLVALIPVGVSWSHGRSDVGLSAVVYLLSCVPASASALYKEEALTVIQKSRGLSLYHLQTLIHPNRHIVSQ